MFKVFLRGYRAERFSLDLIEAVKNVVGVLECLEFIIAD